MRLCKVLKVKWVLPLVMKWSLIHAFVLLIIAMIMCLVAGDENRKVLLDMGGIDPLLRLVQHEDRTVHRNAAMALGVLAQHRKL